MCTITLVPHLDSLNGFILTSNRDEAIGRKTLPPHLEIYQHSRLYFPKDEEAGGTWLGVSEHQRCICLMNGAEKPHIREPEYRKSRGVVVKDFLSNETFIEYLEEYDFKGIEPFTMVIVDWQNGLVFYELIWNGNDKKLTRLPIKDHIWSSSPLYSEEMKAVRVQWFEALKRSKGFSSKTLLEFHYNAGKGNKDYGLVIDRGFLKTQSISQVINSNEELKFSYENLENNKRSAEHIQFKV